MSQRKSKEYNSVDLTEDEDSSEGNSGVDSPFHFVDCSGNINDTISAVSQFGPPADLFENTVVSPPTECSKPTNPVKNIPTLIVKPCVQTNMNKKVEQFTSVQIKPPTNSESVISEEVPIQEIATVSLDSGNEPESANCLPSPPPLLYNPQLLKQTTEITLPKNDTIYSPKQPPGKVVIIKKNNKFYKIIIPHNVMPNISKSMGPVLINIPEVGPLVISNDPQAAKAKPNQFKAQQLSLNLDAIDQNQDNGDTTKTVSKIKDLTLRDKKFCWTFNTTRKRDLEGFSSSDRLGFNKAEMRKAAKCAKMMTEFLTKCQFGLMKKVDEYEKFKESVLKKNEVKLVKIHSIMQASSQMEEEENEQIKLEPEASLQQQLDIDQQKTDSSEVSSTNNTVEMDDYGSDLLVTKKIVILNKRNREKELKRPNNKAFVKKGGSRKMNNVQQTSKIIKNKKLDKKMNFKATPCYVHIIRDKQVEEAYIKYCKGMDLNIRKKSDLKTRPNPIGTTSKIVLACPVNMKQVKLFQNKNMLLVKIIQSEFKLMEEINVLKPILLVTEQTITTNRAIEYYCNEFSKNNIIYIVNSRKEFPDIIVEAEGFISAVEIGYVKLVDTNLFCKFAANGMTFSKTELNGHCTEHSYSYTRK